MITDAFLELSSAQAVTVSAVSENTIDLEVARDIGEGENLFMVFTPTVDFAGGTSIDFQIITSPNEDLSAGTVIGSTGAILTANLTAGDGHVLPIPPKIGSLGEQYLGVNFLVAGTMSAGEVDVDITLTVQDGLKFYASGFTV